jgi:hypothetical protein
MPGNKTPQQGAATTLVAALAPEFGGDAETAPTGGGVRQWALDPDAARRLWGVSARMLGG